MSSYVDSLKTSARIPDLEVRRGEVWIYVPGDLDLTQTRHQHVVGAQGIVFVPSDAHPRKGPLAVEARQLSEKASQLNFRMVAGLEPKNARFLANVRDIAKHASVLTIYDGQKLRKPANYRTYVERLVKEAKAANPPIKIEIASSTGANDAASKALAGVWWNCADLVDRIGIYCDDSSASRASLALYYKTLRADS